MAKRKKPRTREEIFDAKMKRGIRKIIAQRTKAIRKKKGNYPMGIA